ncbi:glycosyltransferase [Winogradskya humida]|uniref:Glycosyltransferase 2-like domain-containing protein n=1 Tax=Winogradskya humida TaxID=113566 RepID=A0ABQ3ZER9_9ACTN|nr:glycosyltransferase [Actinoplanes humidus]GIE17009.1 hypothetical protein Ahu01nite_001110 [Actinoplanes humidus]
MKRIDGASPEAFASDFVPVPILDVELDDRIEPPALCGPVRLLVRSGGAPVGFLPFSVTERHRQLDDLRPEIRAALPALADVLTPATAGVGRAPGSAGRSPLTVTVVVTACEASPGLLGTLRSLLRQSQPADEIILVDNRPETSGLAGFLAGSDLPGVRLLLSPRPGVSHARNDGLAHARGDIVAYTDDDVMIDANWLRNIAAAFTDDSVGCVTGLVLPWELETPAQALFEQFGGFSKGFRRKVFEIGSTGEGALYPYCAGIFGTGANCAFRAESLRAVGGFDAHLGTGTPALGGEDLDIHLTMVRSGYRLVYEPGALIRHRHHRDYPDLRRQVFTYGAGLSAMLTKRWMSAGAERREIAARILPGMRHLLSPESEKNAAKTDSYPLVLTFAELLGICIGPFAYCYSRLSARFGGRYSSRR